MFMDLPIRIVPAIKSIVLGSTKIDFIYGINILTGERQELRSIYKKMFGEENVKAPSKTSIEYFHSGSPQICKRDNTLPRLENVETIGNYLLRLLQSQIETAGTGTAVIIDECVLGSMDNAQYAQAIKILNTSQSQIICAISNNRSAQADFTKAMVISCELYSNGNHC